MATICGLISRGDPTVRIPSMLAVKGGEIYSAGRAAVGSFIHTHGRTSSLVAAGTVATELREE